MAGSFSEEKGRKVKEFNAIKELYKQREYSLVKKNLTDFLNKYPDDNIGWHYYAKLFMQEANYDEALMVLENNNPEENFMMQIDMVKCYIGLERYEESYVLASSLEPIAKKTRSKYFLRKAIIYSLQQLGQPENLQLTHLNYEERQTLSYSRKKALKYIKKTDSQTSLFQKYIDLEKLMNAVEPLLQQATALPNTAELTDTYLFHYPNVGVSEDKSLNILKVATIHKTHNILAMHPIIEYKNYPKSTIYQADELSEKVLKKDIN